MSASGTSSHLGSQYVKTWPKCIHWGGAGGRGRRALAMLAWRSRRQPQLLSVTFYHRPSFKMFACLFALVGDECYDICGSQRQLGGVVSLLLPCGFNSNLQPAPLPTEASQWPRVSVCCCSLKQMPGCLAHGFLDTLVPASHKEHWVHRCALLCLAFMQVPGFALTSSCLFNNCCIPGHLSGLQSSYNGANKCLHAGFNFH